MRSMCLRQFTHSFADVINHMFGQLSYIKSSSLISVVLKNVPAFSTRSKKNICHSRGEQYYKLQQDKPKMKYKGKFNSVNR